MNKHTKEEGPAQFASVKSDSGAELNSSTGGESGGGKVKER